MKKYFIETGASAFLLFIMLAWNGCDEFNSLPLNIPLTMKINMLAAGGSLSGSKPGCLSTDSDTYSQNKNNIKSLHFVEAAFRTLYVSETDLAGDISVTLQDENGAELFNYAVSGMILADYMKPNQPYIFQLDQEQVDFIDAYLDDVLKGTGNSCFNATVTVNNIVNGGQIDTLNCAVDMVIEADIEF